MAAKRVKMPHGGDESIEPGAVFVIRDATDVERDEAPNSLTCIWGGGFRVYPAEPLVDLIEKFSALKLARLTSPGGMAMFISAERVTDRDDRSTVQDHSNTRSVLLFGPGPGSPRVRVRETRADLIAIWEGLKLNTDPIV
ncbi:MAG: hypothetical protein E5Y73_01970 [Mesorhizobium sp.]|uniref:hypothetical protein n=1 Tax=Mesorhizobium sp. TaxID=1871066 RepID=UPI0011FA91E5|nr:hypothetical protein [Mesorhizobium sp.]TIL96298.1 MAG: hypothetical protein E5Y73_01970 [Mesorhizobium sp.]